MAADTQQKTSRHATTRAAAKAQPSIGGGGLVHRRGAAIRTASHVADLDSKKPVSTPDATDGEDEGALPLSRVATLIETVELQAAIISLIVFDLVSTIVSLLLRSHYEILRLNSLVQLSKVKKSGGALNGGAIIHPAEAHPSMAAAVLLRLLDSLAGFTIVFFTIELAVLVFTFRRRFFAHFGYVIDVLVVGSSVGLEVYTESSVVRLLGVLRVWRVFRLVETLLEREQNEHERTMDALETEKTHVLQLQYEKQAAEHSLKRELESRGGIERMLQGYKDEADTLREALTIAAQTVAEATMQAATSVPEKDEQAGSDVYGSSVVDTSGVDAGYQDWTYAHDPAMVYKTTGWEREHEQAQTEVYWEEHIGTAASTNERRGDAVSDVIREKDGDTEEDEDAAFADARGDND